jgi:hypothetical protein
MKKLYRPLLSVLALTLYFVVRVNGQSSIIVTDRSPIGIVSFLESSKLSGISDTKHVDGYVKKYGNANFIFPVGQGGSYRPFAADGNAVSGAYFSNNPQSASLPSGGPFNLTSKDSNLDIISSLEYWDIDGSSSTKLTLTWNARSNISVLTKNSLSLLTIAGWNSSSSRWEKIASTVDNGALLGGNSSFTTGSISTLIPLIPEKYSVFTLASATTSVVPSELIGTLETAGCDEITGWVWDKSYAESYLMIEVLDGINVVASGIANEYREDLKNTGIGTGKYGFKVKLPANLISDGTNHQISVRVKNTSFLLTGSPKTINCAISGELLKADCEIIEGWIWDKNNPGKNLIVQLWIDQNFVKTVTANIFREHLKTAGIGTGNYGFAIPYPESIRDGKTHNISVRLEDSSYELAGSPKAVTCALSQFQGFFEFADCNNASGWVWDKKYPNAALTVELMEGDKVLATTRASSYLEYVKTGGYGPGNTGNYGYKFTIPPAINDGKAHQLTVRVQGSNYVLGSSPRTVTCAVNQYQGFFEFADCNKASGWVWDKNNPNAVLTVELMEGTTVLATAQASSYLEYVKNAGYGPGNTGNYGYKFTIPPAINDGKAHQLTVRVQGSNYVLGNSPKTVTCAVNQYQGFFEFADCNKASGWVWDKNNPNAVLTVELMEGTTVLATAQASSYLEYVKNAGYGPGNTGNYGYKFTIPPAINDGKAHQLTVRVQGSNYVLGNSPKTVTCQIPAARISSDVEGGQKQLYAEEPSSMHSLDLQVSPNPSSGLIKVTVQLSIGKRATLSLTTKAGNLIFSRPLIGTGLPVKESFDLQDYPSGIYLVILNSGIRKEVKRIVIVK